MQQTFTFLTCNDIASGLSTNTDISTRLTDSPAADTSQTKPYCQRSGLQRSTRVCDIFFLYIIVSNGQLLPGAGSPHNAQVKNLRLFPVPWRRKNRLGLRVAEFPLG